MKELVDLKEQIHRNHFSLRKTIEKARAWDKLHDLQDKIDLLKKAKEDAPAHFVFEM